MADCGRRTAGENQLERFVESGSVATRDAWPWHVALLVDGRYHCSATLISTRWLLTSARCLAYVRSCAVKAKFHESQWRINRGSGGLMNRGPEILGAPSLGPKIFYARK